MLRGTVSLAFHYRRLTRTFHQSLALQQGLGEEQLVFGDSAGPVFTMCEVVCVHECESVGAVDWIATSGRVADGLDLPTTT